MKRRKFVKTSAAAVGLVGSLEMSPLLAATVNESPKTGASLADNRPAEYLNQRARRPILAQVTGSREIVPDPTDAAGRTDQAEDCATAGLLQHRPREIWLVRHLLPAMAR